LQYNTLKIKPYLGVDGAAGHPKALLCCDSAKVSGSPLIMSAKLMFLQ